jgi:hypothetical protein
VAIKDNEIAADFILPIFTSLIFLKKEICYAQSN